MKELVVDGAEADKVSDGRVEQVCGAKAWLDSRLTARSTAMRESVRLGMILIIERERMLVSCVRLKQREFCEEVWNGQKSSHLQRRHVEAWRSDRRLV